MAGYEPNIIILFFFNYYNNVSCEFDEFRLHMLCCTTINHVHNMNVGDSQTAATTEGKKNADNPNIQ